MVSNKAEKLTRHAEELRKAHAERFHADGAKVYRAPGRVNLIGEHTDYTGGLVLPIAIAQAAYVSVTPNSHGEIRVFSTHEKKELRWPVAAVPYLQPSGEWGDYVAGVAQELRLAGYAISAVSLRIASDVPIGAGLSSSASLEVATALAFLAGREIAPKELALLAQRAENRFVGMPCGIMDQSVSVMAKAGSALRIDCRTLETTSVTLPNAMAIVAVKSHKKHDLGKTEYPLRVAQCKEATAAIARVRPEVKQLRDATLADLASAEMSEAARKRTRHIIGENKRVDQFVAAAQAGEVARLGKLASASHISLRDDFQVSCRELDALVEMASALPYVYGARMTGGGFGGCTVNFLAADKVDEFRTAMQANYAAQFGVAPEVYVCEPSEGAGALQ